MTDPKYQISCFPGNDKGTQWVVRSDDFEEIQKMKSEMESLYPTQMALRVETPASVAPTAPQSQLAKDIDESLAYEPDEKPIMSKACWKCGEPATYREGVSQKGKRWRAYFCSTDNKAHVQWL